MNKHNHRVNRITTGITIFLLVAVTSFAQDDEIPTYHTKRDGFAKIMEPDIRKDLASFTLGGLDEAVGKQPLQPVPITEYGANYTLFSQGNMQIRITAAPFEKAKHKLALYDEDKYVIKIDNRPYWGVDGKVPVKQIQSVVAIFGRDTVALPAPAYNDLFEPRFCSDADGKIQCNCAVYLSPDQKGYISICLTAMVRMATK